MGRIGQGYLAAASGLLGAMFLYAMPALAQDEGPDEGPSSAIAPALRPMSRPDALVSAEDMAIGAALAAVAALPEAADLPPRELLAAAPPLSQTEPPEGMVEARISRDPGIGTETGLPLPRYVSLRSGDSNVRRGPSLSHRIDWVYTRENMPLRVTAEFGHWRRVEDRDGMGGWVHFTLLSGSRTVIVIEDLLPLLSRPQEGAPEVALLETGVIARLNECDGSWCRIASGGFRGWAPRAGLWGVVPED